MKTNHNSSHVIILASFFVCLVSSPFSFSQEPQKAFPPATIPNTEVRNIHSQILNTDLVIYVRTPMSYSLNKEKKYTAWYFTDADLCFPLLAYTAGSLEIMWPGSKESVIVAIGYKLKDMMEWFEFRSHDLTIINHPPTDSMLNRALSQMTGRSDIKTGGSELFLSFIEKELIPFVESNYRVIPGDRYLGGYSYGGLFALYTLFTKPELFTKYLAGSPSIDFGGGALYEFEKKYSSTHKDLNAKLLMTAGGLETVLSENMLRMADTLKSRQYPGLSVETIIFPDETHATCVPAAIMRGYVVLNKR